MIAKAVGTVIASGKDLWTVLFERLALKIRGRFEKSDAAKKANEERELRDIQRRLDLRCEPGEKKCD